MKKWLAGIIIVLLVFNYIQWEHAKNADANWEISEANAKAYSNMLSASKKKSIALGLTVDQLEYYSDSVLQKLNETRKELKIKDKDLKALQSMTSTLTKTDTLVLTDTLYKDPSLAIDTVIGDEWYKVNIGLKYPSTISVTPEFKSEKHVIVSTKRETINPPKKFFLFRWFQKKHTVLQMQVIEKSPYIQDENSNFVEIIK